MSQNAVIYLCYRAYGSVSVKIFSSTQDAMFWLRWCKGSLIEMRRITADRPDGIVLAEAK